MKKIILTTTICLTLLLVKYQKAQVHQIIDSVSEVSLLSCIEALFGMEGCYLEYNTEAVDNLNDYSKQINLDKVYFYEYKSNRRANIFPANNICNLIIYNKYI